ncbi:MAG: isocitrate/isopropylmalate dehydrogenase family protein [Candidatus Heimdallarchaeota archaeon]|nr:isocitrate/isopropylmalate dehydrogenase family protein [Candidatus Heimdallarchaeota archaeon]
MSKYKIAILPGDGIGIDVVDATIKVLDTVGFSEKAEYQWGDIGWEFWCNEGNPLPDRTIDLLKQTDCALFGAITSKPKEEADLELSPKLKDQGLIYFSPIVKLRQMFDLYTNQRPCKAYPSNPINFKDDIDLVVFRENTEGLYVGIEYHPVPEEVMSILIKTHPKAKRFENESLDDIAISTRIFTRAGVRRILKSSMDYAKEFGYPTVTLVEKPNVIRETSGLMVREARKLIKEYEGIELWETNIDAMTMWLVKNPEIYGVLVSSNMFGDIVSDLAAQLIGGLGFASSGNIGKDYAVFEPTHGSAPKYVGMNKVNPIACILAGKMMLDWLGEKEMATRIDQAVAEVIKDGVARTYDMGGDTTTSGMADAICEKLKKMEVEISK